MGEKQQSGYGITMTLPRAMTDADKLRVILAAHVGCNPAEVRDSDRLGSDFGFEAGDHASILSDIETEFGLAISDSDYAAIETIADLIAAIERGRAGT